MEKILIASNNSHKITEIKDVLKDNDKIKFLSLRDFGISVEVIEDEKTLEKNAFKKAKEVYEILKTPTLSDDTGLFVNALNGEPGIYSARYAGANATYQDNRNKLLDNLKNISEEKRSAQFESVICFYMNQNKFYFFKGVCKGKIINEVRGKNGFGYDPLFVPDGFKKTFAEMSDEKKNKISHRALALQEFKKFIDSYLE